MIYSMLWPKTYNVVQHRKMIIKYSLSKINQLSCGGRSQCPASFSSQVKFASITYRLISILMDQEKENFPIVYKRCEKCKKESTFLSRSKCGGFCYQLFFKKKNQPNNNFESKNPQTTWILFPLQFLTLQPVPGFCLLLFCATLEKFCTYSFTAVQSFRGNWTERDNDKNILILCNTIVETVDLEALT